MWGRFAYRAGLFLAVAALAQAGPQVAQAQQTAGVVVDADGVLRTQFFADPTGQLNQQKIEAAKQALDQKVAAASPLRKISLNRLEKAIQAQAAIDRPPTDEMRYLAGLLRVRYVFFYPETNDIVLAGPAEGWADDISGRIRGISSGRPVVELQDLVVALRAYAPGKSRGPVIGCTIDPTQEGLANYQNFLSQIGTRATPNDTEFIMAGLRSNLGLQDVRVIGVSPDTHFAQVMVEADYRMKLIGIGLEKPPIKLASYVDQANPSQIGRNALQRWYFTPNYQCVRVSEDFNAMELVGDGVKLISDDEMVRADGSRGAAGSVNRASRSFTNAFTKKYPDLAERSPVFGQLRNLIDLAIAAAFIQQEDYYGKAGWKMETFLSEEQLPVETYTTPLQVETAVAAVWKGNHLMTPIGGGVDVQAEQALISENLLPDEEGTVQKLHSEVRLDDLKEGQWWWD